MLSSCVKSAHSSVIFSLLLVAYISEGVVIKTQHGSIQGRTSQTVEKHKTYFAFQGIPYAKPPVGNLRFQPPQPIGNWDGILTTDTNVRRCIQTENRQSVGEEDCLYLNVYTPQLPNLTKPPLPVMVWIHGGGFGAGTIEYNDAAPDYFLDQDVVFVSLNYRLGIFGFLSLGDKIAPGNNGLKDQNLALRWIKKNINNFGGDINRITLFGQSAGAASVSYHMLSPLSKGLFHKAIMQAGTAFCLWSLSRSAPSVTKKIAGKFNIISDSSEDILSGLRLIDAYELQSEAKAAEIVQYIDDDPNHGLVFAPVIEPDHPGAYLSKRSYEVVRNGLYNRVPTILGYNSLEGCAHIPNLLRLQLMKFDWNPSHLVPTDMNIVDPVLKNSVGKTVKTHYFGIIPIFLSHTDNMVSFITHDQFVRPIQKFAKMLAKYSQTYFYTFHYQGHSRGSESDSCPGVAHSEELGYLFRRNITASPEDALTRSRMIRLWTNFVKYGNPTPRPDPLLQNKIWLPVSFNSAINSFNINANLTNSVNPDEAAIKFWDKLYEEYGRPPYDTY